jgi:hypothetical protein
MITKNGDLLLVAVAVAYAATGRPAAFAVAAVVAVVAVGAAEVVKSSACLDFQVVSFLYSNLISLWQARCDDDDVGRFVRQDSIFTTAGFWLFFLFNILAYSAFSVTSSMGDALCFTLLGKSEVPVTQGPGADLRPHSGDRLEILSYGLIKKPSSASPLA